MKTKIRVTLMTDAKERFYGPGVQDLLEGIRTYGSVKEACTQMGLSYTKGRRILKHAETVLGYQLVKRQQGGVAGGSAAITEQAERFMQQYQTLTDSVDAHAQKLLEEIFGSSSDVPGTR